MGQAALCGYRGQENLLTRPRPSPLFSRDDRPDCYFRMRIILRLTNSSMPKRRPSNIRRRATPITSKVCMTTRCTFW